MYVFINIMHAYVCMHDAGQESVYQRWAADACDSIAWAIKRREKENKIMLLNI